MSRERFARVERLFQEARRLPEDERAAFLRERAADEPELVAEVEALLADPGADEFLAQPALGADFTVADAAPAMPATIGPYRILRRLGEGGMGVVWLAEQERPRRTLALKVLKPAFATTEVLRRFEREAQVLARLHHPGIAQVYGVGVDEGGSGLPFIAMEYVDGLPLQAFAAEHRLDLRARLRLFVRVCDAVEHAHQRGVIHRDLKPGNVLVEAVEGSPQPKVVDFGIARVTDSDLKATTLRTQVGELLGTVQYMSPEQAGGDPAAVDFRSDVYSLGVVLYELLCGQLPYRSEPEAVHQAVRAILEEEPRPLGAVDPELRGDLETIVGKALEKDPARRYATPAALGADLRHYLDDQPITAHPPSAVYQLRKFAHRNRALVAGLSATVAVLVVGLAATLWQWREAERARAVAERRFEEGRNYARLFMFELDSKLKHLPGGLEARRFVVQVSLDYLDGLARDAGEDPELLRDIAGGYSKIGDIQGAPNQPNLGDPAGALASYGKALELIERARAVDPGWGILAADLSLARVRMGDAEHTLGHAERALEHYALAREEVLHWLAVEPGSGEALDTRCTVDTRIGGVHLGRGELEPALAAYRDTLEHTQRLAAAGGAASRDHAVSLFKLATALEGRGDLEEARESFAGYLELCKVLLVAQPDSTLALRDVGAGHDRLGVVLKNLGEDEESLEHHLASLEISERLVALEPNDAQARFDLCSNYNHEGERALERGDLEHARDYFERALRLMTELVETSPDSAAVRRRHGVALYKMGELERAHAAASPTEAEALPRWRAAERWFESCLEVFVTLRDQQRLGAGDEGVCSEIEAEIRTCRETADALEARGS